MIRHSRSLQLKHWLFVLGVAGIGAASSQVSAKAPKGRYTIANGEATDNKTGLVWRQALNPGAFAFADINPICTSLQNGPWRVPTVKELATIVDESTTFPCVDEEVFPDTPTKDMWSSTPDARDPANAWVVDFATGTVGRVKKTTTLQVRCVK